MVTQYWPKGPQSKPSKWICPEKVKNIETMRYNIVIGYNSGPRKIAFSTPCLWTDGDLDATAATGDLTVAPAPVCA